MFKVILKIKNIFLQTYFKITKGNIFIAKSTLNIMVESILNMVVLHASFKSTHLMQLVPFHFSFGKETEIAHLAHG